MDTPAARGDTLVLQSCAPDPPRWMRRCMDSVRDWCAARAYGHRLLGDELFDLLDPALRERTREQTVIASDLARLRLLQQGLADGHDTVVWLDADFLVFDPDSFVLPAADCAVGRQVWVEARAGRLRAWRQVHNALLMFRRGNSLLDFYAATAERLLRANSGPMPPQFIGPKLLTALHNVAQLPVMESAAMFSPAVVHDLLAGDGAALRLLRQRSRCPPAGANLCASSVRGGALADGDLDRLCARLLATPQLISRPDAPSAAPSA